MTQASDVMVVANGLAFPEGPLALPDGSVILVEIARGTLPQRGGLRARWARLAV